MRQVNDHSPIASSIANNYQPLIEQYQAHSDAFFSSTKHTLLAAPPFANLLKAGTQNLAQQANESLRFAKDLGFNNPIVLGAVPFDVKRPAYLRVSTNVKTAAGLEHLKHLNPKTMQNVSLEKGIVTAIPEPDVFRKSVTQALDKFCTSNLEKVVLSRTLSVDYSSPPDTQALLKNLAVKNTHGFTFAVDLKPGEDPQHVHALVGASPELLISRVGHRIIAHPLAGSEPRSSDPVVDNLRAQQLLHSEKDLREHALVIKSIRQALSPFCKSLDIPTSPSLVSTDALWHLGSYIEGELHDESTCSLTLALAMHPTPAVCGYPTQSAFDAIHELENYDRHLFTGMVGWCNSDGDGEWAVTIRCAQIDNHQVRLYAGAGIVTGSDPQKETAETDAKFNTLLNAMGVSLDNSSNNSGAPEK